MTNENETVADICHEMKTYRNAEAFVECDDGSFDFVSVSDDLPKRIEEAHKREKKRLCDALQIVSRWLATEASDTEVLKMKSDDVRKLVTDALKGGK